ncbi:MAG: hypothetical protein IJ828_00110 [Treponema sp.]|nr:hypothetical protein [Treponema sp.]
MDIVEYKCPNCSADLKFNPSAQKLTCEYCGGAFTIEEIKKLFAKNESALGSGDSEPDSALQSENSDSQTDSEAFSEQTKLYHCSSCGAEIMATDQQTALFCYYCHNPVILSGKMTGKYRPQKVIGFKIGRDEAVKKFKDWCFKPFVPKDFATKEQLDKITGLYVPFWLTDIDVAVDFAALGKNVRRWSSGSYDYMETKEYDVSRRGIVSAKNIPSDGSQRIDDELMDAIEPFDYSEMNDFSMSYLTGFFAEKYDVEQDSILERVKKRIEPSIARMVRSTVSSYTSVDVKRDNRSVSRSDMKYVMLPVWFMSYKYNDKVYEFVMNGQTGKIAGIPPLNKRKLAWCSWALAAACTVAVYVIGGLVMGGIF